MPVYNSSKLFRELRAAGLIIDGCDSTGRIDWKGTPTLPDISLANDIKTIHDPTDYGALNADDIRARWIALPMLKGTPTQIYTAMQSQIDSWASLADAKANLRVWLPLIIATLAWLIMRDIQES